MKRVIIAAIAVLSIAPLAHADYIDDQIAKAEKRMASAEKNLKKWQDCAATREVCLAELREKASKAASRAQQKLADLQ